MTAIPPLLLILLASPAFASEGVGHDVGPAPRRAEALGAVPRPSVPGGRTVRSPDGRWGAILETQPRRRIRMLRLPSLEEEWTFVPEGQVDRLEASPDGAMLLVGNRAATTIVEAASGKVIARALPGDATFGDLRRLLGAEQGERAPLTARIFENVASADPAVAWAALFRLREEPGALRRFRGWLGDGRPEGDPGPAPAELSALVDRLGSDSFPERDGASRELGALVDTVARRVLRERVAPALEIGAASTDPERRRRAAALLAATGRAGMATATRSVEAVRVQWLLGR